MLQGSGVGVGEDQGVLPLHNALPRLAVMAQHVQQQLLAALKCVRVHLASGIPFTMWHTVYHVHGGLCVCGFPLVW